MIKNNYHTHCKYCHHAQGEVEDYVIHAIKHNFEELGMSDHAPVIDNLCELYGDEYAYFASNMEHDKIDIYLKDIELCKEKYKDQIKIYSGFETEFLPKGIARYKKLRNKVDYLILGVHYFEHENRVVTTYSDEVNPTTLKSYADACVVGLESGLFNCLAHPDLFMMKYKNINGERKFDETAIKESRKIIEACIKNNCYIELNSNGLRGFASNSPKENWNYPYYEFWEIAKEYKDLKIIIGADAHNPINLTNENVQRVINFANEIGLKIEDKMEFNH